MPLREQWSLLVKPTHACNLNCQYCFDKPKREAYGNLKMTHETVDRILELCSGYAKKVHLIWHGGEPTLMGVKWYIEAQELIYRHYNTMFEQSMQTNGILLDEKWARLARDYGIRMGMSFDVMTQYVRRGSGNVNLLNRPEIFKKYGMDLGCITVINSQNYKKQIDIYNILKENGFSGAAFNHIYRSKGSVEYGLEMELEEYIREYEKLFKYVINDTSADAIPERSVEEAVKHVIGSEEVCCSNRDCRREWIGINPNGDVYPCDRYVPDKYHMGNIMDTGSIAELYNSEGFKRYYADIDMRFERYCNDCKYGRFCRGGCNANHIAVSGSGSGLDEFSCEQFKRKFNVAYDLLRSIDIFNMNRKLAEIFIRRRALTIPEIRQFLAEKGHDVEKAFRKRSVKNIGEKLFDLAEYKLFRIFNKLSLNDDGNHVDEHFNHTDSFVGDVNDMRNKIGISHQRKKILHSIYEENREEICSILGGKK